MPSTSFGKAQTKCKSSNLLKFPMIVHASDYVNKENEEQESSKKQKRFKSFKQVAQVMITNYRWTKEAECFAQEDDSRHFVTSRENEHLTFNVSAFRSDVRSVGNLKPEVKAALIKSSWERTPGEIRLIQAVVHRIKPFESYPLDLKNQLSYVLTYQRFGAGRTVIQQGHLGMSFYFIISGIVTIQREEKDGRTGEKHVQILGEMSKGDAFGELALLQNSTRTATIICKTGCEFLKIDKEDFNQVVGESQQLELEKKMSIFSDHCFFKNWTLQAKRTATENSKIHVFQPNSIVLKDVDQDYVHFVQSGQCKIVREITVLKTVLPFGQNRLTLVTDKKPPKLSKNRTLEKRYLVIAIIGRGGYFGVGEDLGNATIVSEGKVECLLVNRIVFMKHNGGRDLADLRHQLMTSLPSSKEAFKSFITEYNWANYKKALVDDLIKRRCKPLNTTYKDVPTVITRLHEPYVRKL